jgi:hypothetical protein
LGTSIQQIDLSEFSEEQALELLRTIVKDGRVDQQLEDAKQLCQWLGYLPLALELIANYLAQEPYTNLNEMLGKLQREGLEDKALEIGERENQTQFATAKRGVKAAFDVSWKKLSPENLCKP